MKWHILKAPWWRLQHVMFLRPQEDHKKTTRRRVLMTFAIGLESWRCLEDVLMLSSGLCNYEMKYFRPPLVTSSTRHVYKTTRRPPEEHPRTSPHDACNWTWSMKMSWCFLQGYVTIKWNILKPTWWRLQHVMFIRPQTYHPKISPHGVCKWTWSMKASWKCHDSFFRVMIKLTNKIFKALLDTSSIRHIYARRPNW